MFRNKCVIGSKRLSILLSSMAFAFSFCHQVFIAVNYAITSATNARRAAIFRFIFRSCLRKLCICNFEKSCRRSSSHWLIYSDFVRHCHYLHVAIFSALIVLLLFCSLCPILPSINNILLRHNINCILLRFLLFVLFLHYFDVPNLH